MKTSFISTHAVSQALRYNLMRVQAELTQKQQEATTGRVADPGVALGTGAGRSVSMNRDIERLKGITDSNALAANRLSSTQDALDQAKQAAQDLLSTLTAASSGNAQNDVTAAEATRALDTLTGVLNSSFNGEYLFAGINTDVKPVNDFSDPASPNKAAFDQAFQDYFTFDQNDPAASDITAAEMNDFLDTAINDQFLGAGWSNWSNASDEPITSRITLNETAETSATANDEGLRKLMMVAATVSDLMKAPLGEEAQKALVRRSLELVGESVADLGKLQGRLGVTENRVSDANERMSSQIDVLKTFISDSEGVDPYEAATRVNELMTQMETSYTLTARIQQLSLVRFLS